MYNSKFWNLQNQPIQDVWAQYNEYIKDGYDEEFFKKINNDNPNFGVWITCFVAFLNKDKSVADFLKLWYFQTLKYTTQDQVSFPYVCQKTNIIPYTLPDNNILSPEGPHNKTMFYIKHPHNL